MARTVVRVIRAIHGLPKLRGDDLSTFEVYLGRAGATPHNVLNRFREHQAQKRHPYGAVLFRCPTVRAAEMEGLAIEVVTKLKARSELCVANVNVSRTGNGAMPSSADSVVYMTWRRGCDSTAFTKPLTPDIAQIATEVAPKLGLDRRSLYNALVGLRRPTSDFAVPDIALV